MSADHQHAGQQRAPLLGEGVAAEQDQPVLLGHHAPAGTAFGQAAAGRVVGAEHGVDQPPAEHAAAAPSQQAQHDQRGQRVGPAVEEVAPHPGQHTAHLHRRRAARRRGRRRRRKLAMVGAQRSLIARTPVVGVHEPRRQQRQREVAGHDDRNALDRAAGLVERGVGDRHQIGVADRHRERRVLGQVEVLAGDRRDDHAQRLRQQHQAHLHAARQPQRGARFVLTEGHRLDAAAHDLGDVRRGVDGQADQHRQVLRRDRAAADHVQRRSSPGCPARAGAPPASQPSTVMPSKISQPRQEQRSCDAGGFEVALAQARPDPCAQASKAPGPPA